MIQYRMYCSRPYPYPPKNLRFTAVDSPSTSELLPWPLLLQAWPPLPAWSSWQQPRVRPRRTGGQGPCASSSSGDFHMLNTS